MTENAGVKSSKIKFCDMRCEFADFPKEEGIDGSGKGDHVRQTQGPHLLL